MKRVQKSIRVILIIIFTVIATTINVKSADIKKLDEDCKVYDVKDKKDVIIDIYNFYEEGKEDLYQKIEERRIEEERRLEEERLEQERLEQERLEQERLEQERLAYLRQQEMLANRNTNIQLTGDVVSYAKQFVGYPYVGGGTTLEGGTDCSGFVALVYQVFGVSLPRTTSGQANSGYAVSVDAIQPGDIISYGYNGAVTHSALYIGDGLMIHSSTPELGVRIDNMYILPIITIRRVA